MPKQKTEQKGVTVAVVHRLIWLREQIATGERENYCTTDGKCLKFEDDDVDEGDGPTDRRTAIYNVGAHSEYWRSRETDV